MVGRCLLGDVGMRLEGGEELVGIRARPGTMLALCQYSRVVVDELPVYGLGLLYVVPWQNAGYHRKQECVSSTCYVNINLRKCIENSLDNNEFWPCKYAKQDGTYLASISARANTPISALAVAANQFFSDTDSQTDIFIPARPRAVRCRMTMFRLVRLSGRDDSADSARIERTRWADADAVCARACQTCPVPNARCDASNGTRIPCRHPCCGH